MYSSVFSFVAGTIGPGIVPFPYAVMMNGYVLGSIYTVLGALISYHSGMMLVKCAEKTGRSRFEDIALAVYGKKAARIASYLYLICLIGFNFSYIVYIKEAIP